jgi:TfuA protein
MTRPVVYAGPSVDAASIQAVADVEVLPPVRRGDLAALFARPEPPRAVGIIDGVFLQALAVSPKEILDVMDHHDVTVLGSSSMGALRAAELADYGMVGVGRIAELYRSGAVDADDEVAVTIDPDTQTALSEPMVNIRVALAAAVDRGVVPAGVAAAAVDAAKALYFPDRTYPAVLLALAGRIASADLEALSDYVLGDPPNAKRDDALDLVRALVAPR